MDIELYPDKAAAIIDLHERGFTEDFKVIGDRILWVQRKLFFNSKDFSLVESYSFIERDGSKLLVIGASLLPHFADGILIREFEHAFDNRLPLIHKKIKEAPVKIPFPGGLGIPAAFCWLHAN